VLLRTGDRLKEFVYWSEVQQRLNEHVAHFGTPYSFYDAVRELWTEKRFHKEEELPSVKFAQWNVEDLDVFDRLMEKTPVDLNIFKESFRREHSATRAQQQIAAMDMIPAKQAWNHIQGMHRHDAFEMIYAMRGQAHLKYEGGSKFLAQGTFCIVSPAFLHDVEVDCDCQLISIPLTPQTIEDALRNLFRQDNALISFLRLGLEGKTAGFQLFSVEDEISVRNTIRSIFHECYAQEIFSRQIKSNYIEILFAQVLRQCGDAISQHCEPREQSEKPAIRTVLKYIEANYKTYSLDEIAKHFHYESSYLGRLIKAGTGKTFTDIVQKLRLDEAKKLLLTTNFPLNEVAEKAGYGSSVQMFRMFRKKEDITPGEYRRKTQRN